MKYIGAAAWGVTVLVWGAGAAAAEASPRRFEAGLRTGYVFVLGSGPDLEVNGSFMLGADLGYRFSDHWGIGLRGQYGFIHQDQQTSDSDVTISGRHVQLGVQGRYRFAPTELVDPWLGLGFGYDWLSYRGEGTAWGEALTYRGHARGFELIEAQLGVDFNAWPALALGPYFGVSHVHYRSSDGLLGAASLGTCDWLSLGAKATLRF